MSLVVRWSRHLQNYSVHPWACCLQNEEKCRLSDTSCFIISWSHRSGRALLLQKSAHVENPSLTRSLVRVWFAANSPSAQRPHPEKEHAGSDVWQAAGCRRGWPSHGRWRNVVVSKRRVKSSKSANQNDSVVHGSIGNWNCIETWRGSGYCFGLTKFCSWLKLSAYWQWIRRGHFS